MTITETTTDTHQPADSALPDPSARIEIQPFEAVIGRFLAMADEHPHEPAVVLDGTAWSYEILRTAALGLARELEGLGVGPGDAVGVTGAKCPALIAVVLAVLARNAILVPLDPMLPAARRQETLARAGVVLLVEAGDATGIGPIDVSELGIRRFSLPAVPDLTDDVRAAAEAYELPEIGGDDPCYLLFTSGTTGEPKGIVGRQRGLSHFLEWERDATGIGPGDRTGQLTGLSFDVVLRDLFLPLTSGAALHLPPFSQAAPPSQVLEFLARDRVTLIHAVPTVATFWLSDVPDGLQLPDLRWVLFAGEPLPGALVRRWRDRFGAARIGNLYGPTETTLAKCFAEIGAEPEPGVQPVGRAIPGAQALVMQGVRLCDAGETGEIVIRTPYRSLGYLGAAGEPRPPFIQNPFTDDPDDVVYRTGDRGRYRDDGVLEIHGRLDDQVKILGVRIEPSEVTAHVVAHPGVKAATVVARPDPAGDTALVAYVVPEADGVDEADLRSYLADRLIAAKVPRLFITVPELPRTPNGKIDKRSLPEPDWNGMGGGADGADAQPVESASAAISGTASPGAGDESIAAMVGIFRELLGNPRVGPDDDFFRFGGHSLLAARLIQRVQERLGVRIQVRSLFQHPTARGLAELVEAGVDASGARPGPAVGGGAPEATDAADFADVVIPIQPKGTRAPLFVFPGVGSRILFLRHLARRLGGDQPVFALHTRFLDDGTAYDHIEDLAARYVRAMRATRSVGPYRILGFSYGGLVAFEVARQLRAAGQDVAFLGIVDTRLPGLQQHGPWSAPRSIPRRLLNLGAILQPLSGPARRQYLRTRLLIARQSGLAHVVEWLAVRVPAEFQRWIPAHPYGPEEIAWLRTDTDAGSRYTPQPYAGPLTYFWAVHSQRPPSVQDHREGWAELARDGLDVREIPGNHLTVMVEPLVASTARAIEAALRESARPRRVGGPDALATTP